METPAFKAAAVVSDNPQHSVHIPHNIFFFISKFPFLFLMQSDVGNIYPKKPLLNP